MEPGTGKGPVILEMRGITKRFPGVVANDRVSFDLRRGEVHCIVGENGAGKTTLVNVLYGLYRMDEGEILVDGERVSIGSPGDAMGLGIGMIHQFFTLVPGLTVLENIILGHEPTQGPFLDLERAQEEILRLQERFDLRVDLDVEPGQLAAGQRQKVEILKALYRGAKILVMDEPTSVLAPGEKEELIRNLRTMAKAGDLSIIFITHKLPEAMAASNRITVLRKGRVVDTVEAGRFDQGALAQKMVGRDVLFEAARSETMKGERVLEVRGLEALDDTGRRALRGVSLHVSEGEILGVAGVSGNGQKELVEVIMGLRKAERGEIIIKGLETTGSSPKEIRGLGVGYIPEDRLGRGILAHATVCENLILGAHSKKPFAKGLFTNPERIREHAERLVREYGIETPSVDKPAGKLSGGNILKLILAREFSGDPDLLIADKPTSGLDVGSEESVRRRLMEERGRGKAILLVSEDLDEVTKMSDRIAVMYDGEIMGVIGAGEVTREEMGEMIAGTKRSGP